MVATVAVPQAVANVPPEYPHYLPPTYNRIHANDLHQHWQEWDRDKEWHKYDWYKNELKPGVAHERLELIQHEREEHRVKRERIREAQELRHQEQQEQRRLAIEHRRQVANQMEQRNNKPDNPKLKKEREKQERQKKAKERKQKKKKKSKKEKKENQEKKRE